MSLVASYADAAPLYLAAGWSSPLPLPEGKKTWPPKGFTGRDGIVPDVAQIEQWRTENPDGNVALRLGTSVIGIDIDVYRNEHAREDLEALLGCKLPPTWSSSSRHDGSGIYLFAVPPPKGRKWKSAPVAGVEIVQRGHRYVVVFPSVHPEGRVYVWRDNGEIVDAIPTPDDIAELPLVAVEALLEEDPEYAERDAVDSDLTVGEPSPTVARLIERGRGACAGDEGSRHDNVAKAVIAIVRAAERGEPGTGPALTELGRVFVDAVAPDRPGGRKHAENEYADLVAGAQQIVATTEPPAPPAEPPGEGEELDESWHPVDLGPALAGDLQRPEPTILCRDDKIGCLYYGRVNGFHGDSGVGKSFAALVTVKDEIEAGHHVIWIDLEDPDPMTVIGRLRDDLGVDPDIIRERFHYYGPTEPFGELPLQEVERAIRQYHPTLVVIDSVGEAFGLEGIDENKDAEVGPWMRRVARRLADGGPAVLLLDHSTKAADNPLHPSGSKRKRAAITGASYLIEAPRPLVKGEGGRLSLTTAKDRHGTHRVADVAAEIEFTSYPDGGMTVHVWSPSLETAKDTRVYFAARAAVTAAKNADRPLTQNSLEQLMQIKAGAALKRAGIEAAVARRAIAVSDGPNRSRLHTYLRDLTDLDKEALLA